MKQAFKENNFTQILTGFYPNWQYYLTYFQDKNSNQRRTVVSNCDLESNFQVLQCFITVPTRSTTTTKSAGKKFWLLLKGVYLCVFVLECFSQLSIDSEMCSLYIHNQRVFWMQKNDHKLSNQTDLTPVLTKMISKLQAWPVFVTSPSFKTAADYE